MKRSSNVWSLGQRLCIVGSIVISLCLFGQPVFGQVLGDVVDTSGDFQKLEQVYFVGNRVVSFDPGSGSGALEWARYMRQPSLSFEKIDLNFTRTRANEFPGTEYDENPALPFSLSFVSPRTIRLRIGSRSPMPQDADSLMLAGPPRKDDSWKVEETKDSVSYKNAHGQVRLIKNPWRLEFLDSTGRLLTRTMNMGDTTKSFSQPVPFSFVRRAIDLGRSMAASFQLSPEEKIFGCGESFTRLNKRGQKLVLFTRDAMGVQTGRMYKPIPFFMSSIGYGMFVHTSAPVTFCPTCPSRRGWKNAGNSC